MGEFFWTEKGGKYQIKFKLTPRSRAEVYEFKSAEERSRFAAKMRSSRLSESERKRLEKKYRLPVRKSPGKRRARRKSLDKVLGI